MSKFIVDGGVALRGEIEPAGNKNEALPIVAATLLTREPVMIDNIPGIGDVKTLIELLEICGVSVSWENNCLQVQAAKLTKTDLPPEYCTRIRGSILLLAPFLSRCGRVRLPLPGGDRIGRRRIDSHLLGLQLMGAEVALEDDCIHLWSTQRLHGADILLDEASVTATENLVMAASLADGVTVLRNAASEPHVQQLCHLLNQLGANISGIGSNVLTIEGVEELHGGQHRIAADYLEVGSFIGLTAVTRGELLIRKAAPEYMRMILHQFSRLGIEVEVRGEDIWVPSNQPLTAKADFNSPLVKIDDSPWPAFPADMMSIAVIIATQTQGTVMIFEKMFESRLFFVDRLIGMGANIILCDPHRAVVVGPTPLRGRVMSSPDIRAGMALLTAALCAEGRSEIQNIEQIDRGYERLDERLAALGAHIRRED